MKKASRNYDREYKKFHSGLEAKKKRAVLNSLKDCPKGKDNSHQKNNSVKCEDASKNRGRNSDSETAGGRHPGGRKDKSTWGKTPK